MSNTRARYSPPQALAFCGTHFPDASPPECVEAMLLNMQMAYEEASEKAGAPVRGGGDGDGEL